MRMRIKMKQIRHTAQCTPVDHSIKTPPTLFQLSLTFLVQLQQQRFGFLSGFKDASQQYDLADLTRPRLSDAFQVGFSLGLKIVKHLKIA